jgi:tRNA pseudouridine55 synthase
MPNLTKHPVSQGTKRLIADGFLVVDKSAAMTSHDVVAIARRSLKTKKVGHAGTLDPMATGVLVLGFGNGTRLLQYVTEGSKTYEATMVLGSSTVTDDFEGKMVTQATADQIRAVTDDAIRYELAKMRGTIMQRPSSVSAVKVDGERAHARVRAGEEFELPAREVKISRLEVGEIRRSNDGTRIEVDLSVVCGAGTFIRAIARDCGIGLGIGGHLSVLRRTRVDPFDLAQAISVEALKSGDFEPLTIAMVAARTFNLREISWEERVELSFGRPLVANPTDAITAAMAGDALVALLVNRDGKARPITVFAAQS